MDKKVPPEVRKWAKRRVKEEFDAKIQEYLSEVEDPFDAAQKIISSREMSDLLYSLNSKLEDERETTAANPLQSSALDVDAQPRTHSAMSFISDLSLGGNDYATRGSGKRRSAMRLTNVIAKMSYDKPVHLRLSGYEVLLANELTSVANSQSFELLLKTLRDGLLDESRSVFEASLRVHARLLNGPKAMDAYMNLFNSFNAHYHSRKLHDVLPSLLSGINFKIFLHEKLLRIMHLVLRHQEEVLKGIRTIEKEVEDVLEQFLIFVSFDNVETSNQVKSLNILNILSVLEPYANWSKKWNHNLLTRQALLAALSKSRRFFHEVVASVAKGLEKSSPPTISLTINEDPMEVYISGESVETLTYLHCCSFLMQLCSYKTSQRWLSEVQLDIPFAMGDFMTVYLNSLNNLAASDTPNGVYNACRQVLRTALDSFSHYYDSRFYQLAVSPLMRVNESIVIWPHTLDVMKHMLESKDGLQFMLGEYKSGIEDSLNRPLVAALTYASNLLRQPLSLMTTEHVGSLLEFIESMFREFDVYDYIADTLQEQFYPAVAYFYSKIDKYCVENENKTQFLDSALKNVLLRMTSIPLALRLLINEEVVFEELIRGLIAPLRSWRSVEVAGCVSNSAYFSLGCRVLAQLATHVLSTLITDICSNLEDPVNFHDPWDNENVQYLLHMLALFSLNTKCFFSFVTASIEVEEEEVVENERPTNVTQLMEHSVDSESPYHLLGLMALRGVIWNLDINIYLLDNLKYQKQFLLFQEDCYQEQVKCVSEDSDNKTKQKSCVIDEASILRHEILLDTYYLKYKRKKPTLNPEEIKLFTEYPPPNSEETLSLTESDSYSELEDFLQGSESLALRDSGWISQVRKTHKASRNPMKRSVLISLLNQMQKANPTAEWVDQFTWETVDDSDPEFWLPEELCGMDVALNYAEQRDLLKVSRKTKENLKLFIESTYAFINYKKPSKFEGFDWFLATVFIVCEGDFEQCKNFMLLFIHFSSAIYVWPALGKALDQSNEEESLTQFIFAHYLESVISSEFPATKYALRKNCGIEWWMICNRAMSQCFFGILPWSEIMNYLSICMLYPADYLVYYFSSLLQHCQTQLLSHVVNGKLWPENLIFDDFQCLDHVNYMDRLGKRYRNRILPKLSLMQVEEGEPECTEEPDEINFQTEESVEQRDDC